MARNDVHIFRLTERETASITAALKVIATRCPEKKIKAELEQLTAKLWEQFSANERIVWRTKRSLAKWWEAALVAAVAVKNAGWR